MTAPEILASGRFLRLIRRDGWEYASRTNARAVVGIVAVTPAGGLLLVEQERLPVGATVIELPAGLVGDEAPDEDLAVAAGRELVEETGWEAERLQILGRGPSSAGLCDEITTLVRAAGLRRVGAGGGVAGERITVHEVPLAGVPAWLAAQERAGRLIDHKIIAGLWWLAQVPAG